jgi:hypothetical protein
MNPEDYEPIVCRNPDCGDELAPEDAPPCGLCGACCEDYDHDHTPGYSDGKTVLCERCDRALGTSGTAVPLAALEGVSCLGCGRVHSVHTGWARPLGKQRLDAAAERVQQAIDRQLKLRQPIEIPDDFRARITKPARKIDR